MIIKVDTIASLLADERDVVTEIIGTEEAVYEDKRMALTSMYRYRMIGSCDVDRWVQAMKDRAVLLRRKWDPILRLVPGAATEMVTSSSTTTTTYDSTVGNEDLPDTLDAEEDTYLSTRSKRRDDGSISVDTTDGLPAEIRRRRIDEDPEIFIEWAKRFEDLFLRMW